MTVRRSRVLTAVFAVAGLIMSLPLGAAALEDESEIVIVGGTGVVSEPLEEHLRTCTSGGLSRFAGPDRYATAAAIADNWDTAATVFLATGLNYPDAIAAGPVAGLSGSPVLLTHPEWLPSATNTALTRLQPERVVIVGGPSVVSASIESTLRARFPEVIRLAGSDRFATAEAVASWQFPNGSEVVYVATGMGYHDALLAGPAAVRHEAPLLLVTRDTVPIATRRALEAADPSRIVLVGGSGVVSTSVETELAAYATVVRLGGTTLAKTAAMVGADAPGSRAFIATKEAYADGLALVPHSAGSPTYFVGERSIDEVTASAIASRTAVGCEAWSPPYPDVGAGKRIIYSNSQQRVWLVNEDETLHDTYLVSGRKGRPYPGTYQVFSKSLTAWAGHDGITMKHMVRFVPPWVSGNRLSIGFHAIPRDRYGVPLQTEDELGTFQSAGCVRQSDDKAAALYAWAPIGTPVVALP
jgi:putative cell wall-binding protein